MKFIKKYMSFNKIVFVLFLLFIFFKIFVFDIYVVTGSSMYPAINDGDFIVINKLKTVTRLDIIYINKDLKHLNNKIVKRVIGFPNETIEIKKGRVFINDRLLEDYKIDFSNSFYGLAEEKIKLASDEYFVIGDNINKSYDSRVHIVGLIKKNEIKGVVVKIINFNRNKGVSYE